MGDLLLLEDALLAEVIQAGATFRDRLRETNRHRTDWVPHSCAGQTDVERELRPVVEMWKESEMEKERTT